MTKQPRKTIVFFSIFAVLAITTIACGLSAPRAITGAVITQPEATVEFIQAEPTTPAAQLGSIVSEDQVLVELYSRLNPSVVNISVFLTQNDLLLPMAQASGFVFDDQGHIVTNAHVVHGSDALEVTFSDGLIYEASLVGEDLFSDLAVIKVELPEGIKPIPLGNIEDVDVGETVVAIGNPFGLEGTLTRGIISALGRNIPTMTVFSIPQAIQTDAAINPGNSGGPLLNLNGEVVGVNAQIETNGTTDSNLGVGFAIPVSILERVIPGLIENGAYDWPYLGVSGYTVNPPLVKAMDLPIERGAYVSLVTENGPAKAAGLLGSTDTLTQEGRQVEIGGDIITAIDGQPINTFDELLVYLTLQTSPGQDVTLTILRDGQTQEITLTLGSRPIE